MKPDSTQIFKNKDINNEDCNNWRCFTLFPLYQVQTSLKSSSPLPTSITLYPFQSIGNVYCYQCVPAESQIFSFSILPRKFKLWPQWFLGLCSNYQPYLHHTELLIACDPNISCTFWPLPINQFPGTFLLRPQKTQFKCHHLLHEAFLTSTNKANLSWPYNPTALWNYHSISLYPSALKSLWFPHHFIPNETVTFSKKRLGLRMGTHWVLKDSMRQKWKYYSFYCAFSPKFHNWTTEIRQNFTKHSCLTLYCTPVPYQPECQPHSGYIPLQQE